MQYKIVIQGRLPSLNEYTNAERRNRFAGANMKKNAQNGIIVQTIHNIPKNVKTPIWLDFYWIEPNKKRDKDNIAFAKKFILDALVEMGVIKDDGWDYVTGFQDHYGVDKDNPRIEVVITEM